ncbi:mannose 6-phosphate receptor domain-containing protein [Polyporus arcularius HHB13444]|uniref:Mannose 6-phosphate receptor domain-containing protein n=1 Tax=Polyporus arcularius HHB13444 TaxID=1314778 RepID=A0A5C3PZI8_9APHY|nr:mannose 6-phosphate receptor domain-containing protein [Polyporus arcularius HHB13444]
MLSRRARYLWLVCVSVVLLSGLGIAHAEEKPCTTHADGNYYDLNRLKSSNDHEFQSYGGKDYILNVCRPVRQEVWAPKVDKPEDVAGFTHRSHGDFSLGDVNTTVVVHGGHPLIYMTDGSRCQNAGDMTASTVIRFICDGSAGTGKPQLIATLPPDEDNACSFFVEWRTEIACPTSEGSVFGTIVSVLAIIITVLFALYMVGGTLYNRYVLEVRGMDQIPRFSFFSLSDTVAFFRECVERVKDRSSDAWGSRSLGAPDWGRGGSWNRSGRQGYGGLHGSPEEAQTMLGGPPGFLDESDEDEEAPAPPAHTQENSGAAGMDTNGVIRL